LCALTQTTMHCKSQKPSHVEGLKKVHQDDLSKDGVKNVIPDLSNKDIDMLKEGSTVTDDEKVAKMSIVFSGNPYDLKTMDDLNRLRDNDEELLAEAGFENMNVYFAGETAEQADTRAVNDRDTLVVGIAITILITV